MNDQTLLDLAQQAASGNGAALQTLSQRLAALLTPLNPEARDQVLFAVSRELRLHEQRTGENGTGLPQQQVHSPELRDWIRQRYPIAETLAALREIREKGGLELADFIHELEEAARL
jgi:hypothetical protein